MNYMSCFIFSSIMTYSLSTFSLSFSVPLILTCTLTLACVGHFTVTEDFPNTFVFN